MATGLIELKRVGESSTLHGSQTGTDRGISVTSPTQVSVIVSCTVLLRKSVTKVKCWRTVINLDGARFTSSNPSQDLKK